MRVEWDGMLYDGVVCFDMELHWMGHGMERHYDNVATGGVGLCI